MKRIHIVGRKNSGKTTLVVELVEHLSARGLRVGTIKHTHHHHELDTPGKDSHRHREAGASAVGILSPKMSAVFLPERVSSEQGSQADESLRYERMAPLFADCDIVIVEGDSQTNCCKVEVWRAETKTPPMAFEDSSILAIISDDDLPAQTPEKKLNVWPRSGIQAIADSIIDCK